MAKSAPKPTPKRFPLPARSPNRAAEMPKYGPQTRTQLYALAQMRGLEGRSRMSKAELEQALRLH